MPGCDKAMDILADLGAIIHSPAASQMVAHFYKKLKNHSPVNDDGGYGRIYWGIGISF